MRKTLYKCKENYFYSREMTYLTGSNEEKMYHNHKCKRDNNRNDISSTFLGNDMKGNNHLDIDSHHAYMAIPI